LLTHDVLLKEVKYVLGLGKLAKTDFHGLVELFLDDLVAQLDALDADIYAGPSNEFLHLLLGLTAEIAFEQVCTIA
jgi:hypothetical protein